MSEAGEAQGRRDARASGAKPRPEGRVRERAAAADAQQVASPGILKEAVSPSDWERPTIRDNNSARPRGGRGMSEAREARGREVSGALPPAGAAHSDLANIVPARALHARASR
jgi:hypothetical protein